MKTRFALVGMLAVVGAAGIATGQTNPKPPAGTVRPENVPATAEGQAWQSNLNLGEFHKNLKAFVGAWACEVTTTTPGAPTQPSTGTMVNTIAYGGRFITTAFTGEIFGQRFLGNGTWGYNNISNRYESTWIDNMSTGIVFETGSYDAATRTFTMTGNFDDPQTGQKKTQKSVYTFENDNKYTISFFDVGTDGSQKQVMKFACTRRTAEPKATVKTETNTKVDATATKPATTTTPASDGGK